MTGTIVNATAIVLGALAGVAVRRGLPERVSETVMQGLSLSVILLGIQMALQTKNPLIVIGSLVVGGAAGAALDIEGRLAAFARRLEARIGGNSQSGAALGRAFITATLVFCVGAMAVLGSIEDGLTGQPRTLFAKSLLDGIASLIFATTMGIGVLFSAVPVFLYQGTLTLAAGAVQPYLSPWVVAELTATGGLIIAGIGLNLLKVSKIRVGNLLPAIFVAALATIVLERLT
ncbi:MAG: DUF554 domain-containing protein [Thermoanaerobacterales bacterium]|nr:DUF554 domain-containing protein [Thermoanaerobacterales bacterium]